MMYVKIQTLCSSMAFDSLCKYIKKVTMAKIYYEKYFSTDLTDLKLKKKKKKKKKK